MDLIDRQPEERTDKRTKTHACDSISRRAAIRWVKTECNPYGKPTLDFESGVKVIEHLEQMPSAEPEIICCKDCKYFETAGNLLDGLCRRHRIPTTMYSTGFCSRAERREE